MSHQGYSLNEYGVRISHHICGTCKTEFTVTPAKEPYDEGWGGCLGVECDSYDVDRDVDLMFEIEPQRIRQRDP